MPSEESLHTQMQNLIESHQWEQARDVIYEMLKNQPDSSWLHCKLGMVLNNLKDYKNAEAYLKSAISHDSEYAEAYSHLAWTYYGMKRLGTADDTNKQALSLDSQNAQNWILSFDIGLRYNDLERSSESLKQLAYRFPENDKLTDMRTALYSHPGYKESPDIDSIIRELEIKLIKQPKSGIIHHKIAKLYLLHASQSDKAEDHIEKAILLDPTNLAFRQTHRAIVRRKSLLLRLLNLPLSLFEKARAKKKLEELIIVIMVVIAILFFALGEENRYIFGHIWTIGFSLFIIAYPITRLCEYLAYTEIFHREEKTDLLAGPLQDLHRLSYNNRYLVSSVFIIMLWLLVYLAFR